MKHLTLSDLETIRGYVKKYHYLSANYNLVTIFLWSVECRVEFEIIDDVLYLYEWEEGELFAFLPLCAPTKYEIAFKHLIKTFKALKRPLVLRWVPEDLLHFCPLADFKVVTDANSREYVYDAKKIRTLSGKKMQKKRNHYNYFVQNFKYVARELTPADFPAIFNLMDAWLARKDLTNRYVAGQMKGIKLLLAAYGQIEYKLFGVFIDSELKAMTICSDLTPEMVEINIELADGQIRGLYTFITSYAQQVLYPNALFVNREDDAGDESLRKSKLSYYPDRFLTVATLFHCG